MLSDYCKDTTKEVAEEGFAHYKLRTIPRLYPPFQHSSIYSSSLTPPMATTKQMLQLTHEEEEEEACMRALQLASGPVLPLTLKVAIELGILEIIVAAIPGTSLSSQEIAARLPTENPQAAAAVDRILRLLAAYNIVGCTIETGADGHRSRKYSMTTICKYFTKNEDGSLASLVLLQLDKVVLEPWYRSLSLKYTW